LVTPVNEFRMSGTLYIISTPIGNDDDITYRALKILKVVDLILFEEEKSALRFLKHYGLSSTSYELINEHNEDKISDSILELLVAGKNIALTSDAGTPVFYDPGKILVDKAIQSGIKIVPIPGVCSIVPALILSGFLVKEFLFRGFLSQKRNERKKELEKLRSEMRPVVIMDTPYRLLPLLKDLAEVFKKDRRIAVAFNLTMEDEKVFRGWAEELLNYFEKAKLKGEFVIVIEGKN